MKNGCASQMSQATPTKFSMLFKHNYSKIFENLVAIALIISLAFDVDRMFIHIDWDALYNNS